MRQDYPETSVVSVADFVRGVNEVLRAGVSSAWVEGEISTWKVWPSGHAYFTLKDSDAVLECVMFAPGPRFLKFTPRAGLQVIVHGRPDIYAPRGQFKLLADRMLPQGEGLLQLQFQQLVERLRKEGLFDEEWKRPIPPVPERIGLVTSLQGAAVRDFLRTLFGRWPAATIVLADTPVQGEGSARKIAAALLDLASHGDVDVIALVRGGGSLEDLWAFNDEDLARAIRSSTVPVVTGVGHETDVTVADFAADLRASTPTQAAVLLSRNVSDVLDAVKRRRQALGRSLDARLQDYRLRVTAASGRLTDPRHLFGRQRQTLLDARDRLEGRVRELLSEARSRVEQAAARAAEGDPRRRLSSRTKKMLELEARLIRSMDHILAGQRRRFMELPARLDAMSPLKVLSRGYAVLTTAGGQAVRESSDVSPGDELTARLHRGSLTVQVRRRG